MLQRAAASTTSSRAAPPALPRRGPYVLVTGHYRSDDVTLPIGDRKIFFQGPAGREPVRGGPAQQTTELPGGYLYPYRRAECF
ncbi:hypothetical protein ACH4SK_05235 [Streptomyces inhibens]|uniref:hypothetical protein n=1 Tax=Streptomyces inhibens TaxID=2293571 RepID=UPI00379AB20B